MSERGVLSGKMSAEAVAVLRLERGFDDIDEEVRADVRVVLDVLAAWRELADYVRLGACATIWPGRYTDAATRDVAQALRDHARHAAFQCRAHQCRREAAEKDARIAELVGQIEALRALLLKAQPFVGWNGSYPELHAEIDAHLADREGGDG